MNSRPLRGSLMVVLLLAISTIVANSAWANNATPIIQAQGGSYKVHLPVITMGGATPPTPTPPTPTPPTSPPQTPIPTTPTPTTPTPVIKLPDQLVGAWFTGVIPPTDYYDPTTGQWRATNGLGQMYRFGADGAYTYAGFLRIQTGLGCLSEVSVYKQGRARSQGAGTLILTDSTSKTRTVVHCGTHSDTTVDGDSTPYQLGWSVGLSEFGRMELTITEGTATTTYSKEGIAPQVIGTWTRGGVSSVNFYDPDTGIWAVPAEKGGWFHFAANGTFRSGEFHYEWNGSGCTFSRWRYQEGTFTMSGGTLSIKATGGRERLESDCTPGEALDQPYVDPNLRTYVWSIRDRATDPKLVLIPLERYEEFVHRPE